MWTCRKQFNLSCDNSKLTYIYHWIAAYIYMYMYVYIYISDHCLVVRLEMGFIPTEMHSVTWAAYLKSCQGNRANYSSMNNKPWASTMGLTSHSRQPSPITLKFSTRLKPPWESGILGYVANVCKSTESTNSDSSFDSTTWAPWKHQSGLWTANSDCLLIFYWPWNLTRSETFQLSCECHGYATVFVMNRVNTSLKTFIK